MAAGQFSYQHPQHQEQRRAGLAIRQNLRLGTRLARSLRGLAISRNKARYRALLEARTSIVFKPSRYPSIPTIIIAAATALALIGWLAMD
jgi:hypothetical protein